MLNYTHQKRNTIQVALRYHFTRIRLAKIEKFGFSEPVSETHTHGDPTEEKLVTTYPD